MAIESITGRVNNLSSIKSVKKTDVDVQRQESALNIKEEGYVGTTVLQDFRKAVELSSASTVDVDRVSSIKKAIEEGSYKIDAEKIAKKIIEFEKLLPLDDST